MGDYFTLSNTFSFSLSGYELADEGLLRNQGRWVVLGMFSSVCSQRPGYVLTMSAQIK